MARTAEEIYASLGSMIRKMTPAQARTFASRLSSDDLALFESAVARLTETSWRSDPASMATHLTQGDYQAWPYVRLLSGKLVEAVRGEDPRQVWNMPSQMGKTTLLCTWGVPWILQRNPALRIMYVTYDAVKAVEEGGKARDNVERYSEELGIRLTPDRRARAMWRTPEGGGLYAVGIFGGIVGWPADVVLLDDLLKGWQDAHSQAKREAVWAIYRSQVRMRIQSRSCAIVHAGTRWHEEDPSGKMLNPPEEDGGETWTHVRLPALAETHDPQSHDPLVRVPDPLGRAPGEPLEPERFDLEEVLARRATLGSYLSAALEQQRPAPEEGGELKRAWFRLEETLPLKPEEALTSWDLKLKDREAGDYVVGQAWWRVASGHWLVDQLRGKWDHATTACAITLLAVRHPEIHRHHVEWAGSADEVMPQLKEAKHGYVVSDEIASLLGMTMVEREAVQKVRRRGLSGLIGRSVKGSKEVRARAFIAPVAEAGDVHFPAHAPWVPALLDEIAAFPNGTNDDQIDTMSQALSHLARPTGGTSGIRDVRLNLPPPGRPSLARPPRPTLPSGVSRLRRAGPRVP